MQQLAAQQASAEVPINENFETLEHQQVYGLRQPASTGLTWAFYGGRWGGTLIADGTVTLTNSNTNRIVVDRSTGAVSTSTNDTNWNNVAAYARLYRVVTSGGVVSSWEDHRAGPYGVHGQLSPRAISTVASAATIAIPLGQTVVSISGTTGITNITAGGHSGARVTLIFQGALTMTDGGNLRLAGNFTTTADDTITLACDGTNWFETSRSVN